MRAFEDLINVIEFENKEIVPIYEIVSLCFNFTEETIKNKHKMWVNDNDCLWYCFEQKFNGSIIQRNLRISKDYDFHKFTKMGEIEEKYQAVCNQLEIFKYLNKLEFIKM